MTKALRLAVFIPSFADGGAQRQCIILLNEWARRDDIEPILIRTDGGVHDDLLDAERLDVYDVPVRSNYDPTIIPRVATILRRRRSQVLFSWLQASDVPSYFVRAITPGVKWVLAERNSQHPDDWRFRLRGRLGRSADAIIANSEPGLRYWDRFEPRGKRFVVPNAVDHPKAVQGAGDDALRADLLHVGRLEAQKNIPLLLDAFAAVCALRPATTLTIVGDGSQRAQLEAQTHEYGVSANVRFVGFQRDVSKYYAHSRALVSLSRHEGMPNVLAEAVVSGLPVVVSDIPEHRNIVGQGYPRAVPLSSGAAEIASHLLAVLDENRFPPSLEFARASLRNSTPARVADEYVKRFVELTSA